MRWLDPGRPVNRWLLAPAAIYGFLIRLRTMCYRHGWCPVSRLPCRVISVGNLTMGGTGKTPVVILFIQWLQAAGQRVAVLSRGYKRTGGAAQLLVSNGMTPLVDPSESGDEPFLIAQRCPGAIVAVGSDRALLGRWVLDRYPVDCMIMDDGFQHRALHRDLDLVLLDATDATGLDAMLPAGRLREPLDGLTRATGLIITRAERRDEIELVLGRVRSVLGPAAAPAEVRFRPECLVPVLGGEERALTWGKGQKAWLASGVGNSGSFRRSATSLGVEVVGETVFPDHHHYDEGDVREITVKAQAARADLVLTTEKDAGKLAPLLQARDAWWALRIGAEVTKGEAELRRLVCGAGSSSEGRA